MNSITKQELKDAVKAFHDAEVAYLNKMFEGVCEFKVAERCNLAPDTDMEKFASQNKKSII